MGRGGGKKKKVSAWFEVMLFGLQVIFEFCNPHDYYHIFPLAEETKIQKIYFLISKNTRM